MKNDKQMLELQKYKNCIKRTYYKDEIKTITKTICDT